ncbi:hypothetical protein NQ318_011702 [Aromia moschata]|uniref:Uncharacterized protein n=1 Tax=Aromia moschata TaxID=1265417 RepID=A0AAV8XI32_9CUCU|nr:hypothetical protein NQ318_011702 [Aromia moschata]
MTHDLPDAAGRSLITNLVSDLENSFFMGPHGALSTNMDPLRLRFLQAEHGNTWEEIPLHLRRLAWFQLDGCPAHFGRNVLLLPTLSFISLHQGQTEVKDKFEYFPSVWFRTGCTAGQPGWEPGGLHTLRASSKLGFKNKVMRASTFFIAPGADTPASGPVFLLRPFLIDPGYV